MDLGFRQHIGRAASRPNTTLGIASCWHRDPIGRPRLSRREIEKRNARDRTTGIARARFVIIADRLIRNIFVLLPVVRRARERLCEGNPGRHCFKSKALPRVASNWWVAVTLRAGPPPDPAPRPNRTTTAPSCQSHPIQDDRRKPCRHRSIRSRRTVKVVALSVHSQSASSKGSERTVLPLRLANPSSTVSK